MISLSGDHHMHGAAAVAASISDPESDPVLVDFSVAGISSSPVFADLVAAASGSQSSFQDLVFSAAGDSLTPVWNMTMLYGVLAAFLYANTGFATPARWLGPNSANRGLGFIDVTANGYGLAVFGADEVTTELVAITDSESAFEQAPAVRYRARFRVSHWEAGAAPSLETPEFEGTAPFPFGHNSV